MLNSQVERSARRYSLKLDLKDITVLEHGQPQSLWRFVSSPIYGMLVSHSQGCFLPCQGKQQNNFCSKTKYDGDLAICWFWGVYKIILKTLPLSKVHMYPWFTQIKFMCTHCFFAGPLRELVHWMSKRAMTLKSCITEIARGTPPTPLPVIPAFRRLREEDHEIKTDLSHTATLYQRKKIKNWM